MKDALTRGMVAFLFALGLTLPVLGALGLMAYAWTCTAVLLGITAALTVAALNKWTRIGVWGAALAGTLVWTLSLGGADTIMEIVRGMVLQLSGTNGALPLVAFPCAMLLTVIFGTLSWVLTARGIGFYPALAVLLLVLMILWLSSQSALLIYVLPALAAVIVLFVQSTHEELSLRRILPLAAAVVAVSFLLVPSGGVTSPTLKKAAEDLRQRIYDYMFFTEPRNVFSLSTEGYYPQGQAQLGGPAEPTDHPVMQVQTPRRVLLRGTVMNEYTGRMWKNTTGGRRYLYISPRWSSLRQTLFDMSLPSGKAAASSKLLEEQTVTVRMLAENASSLFLPQRVRSLNGKGDLVPYFNNASEIFVTRDLQAGDTYTVTAPLIMAGDAGLGTLIDVCTHNNDPAYDSVMQTYLQLPDHLQQPVYDIAAQIIQGIDTPYEKAFAIQNYLSRNFRYTLDVKQQDESMDFVTNFLINTKEGYCTYFASAMTVLCRMAGLPARYVEGYQAMPDANGLAYVTGLQAHAWTEVYFSGFGWLTFDATPVQSNTVTPPEDPNNRAGDQGGESEPTPTPTPPAGADMETPEPEEQPTPEASDLPEDMEDEPTPTPEDRSAPDQEPENKEPPNLNWLWLLLVLALLGLAAWQVVRMTPQQTAKRIAEPTALFMMWMQAVHDTLRVKKLPPYKTESPMAYAKRLDKLSVLPVDMLPLGETLSLVCYGKLVPEPEEIDMAKATYLELLGSLKPLEKARVYLTRAFIPGKKRDFAQR